ncbi:hypothetical protein I3843_15G101000 [Carya illinoinensis]|nr:hypothetical protein I3843_15G101000 [Carya illinoinensis]
MQVFQGGPNYLSNELRVLDWFEYPLQSLPPNFHGNKLIIFKMHGSFIRELSVIKFKNMTIMEFNDCNSLTKVPDLSSVQNLKELSVEMCTSLVEVHDSVGSLENLCELSFYGCSNLRIFPASLKLRSLRKLYLDDCSSLRSFPEIGCEMKSLTKLSLSCTAVEELPLSIGNLDRLDALFLHGCKNLKRLPINIILRLQHLTDLGIFGSCTNLVKKIGYDGQSILTIGSTRLEDEISSNEEQLQELVPPTNSSNGSSALQVLNRQNCFQSESNFFLISSFFTLFNSSATLTILNLSGSEFISVPTSIKGLVALEMLYLSYCEKLEEILELPPYITLVEAQGCKSLERFPEVSRIMEFNGSHIRSLGIIDLSRCDKMHEKILNYKVPNPLLWKAGHYNVTVLLENQISELGDEEFSEYEIVDKGDEEFSEDEIVNRGDEEWVINIEGPLHLEDISGLVVYAFMYFKIDPSNETYVVTIKSSNHICELDSYQGVYLSNSDVTNKFGGGYEVMVWYSDLESFELKVFDNLRVQLHPLWGQYYRSWGANIVYKHESRAHKKRKMD